MIDFYDKIMELTGNINNGDGIPITRINNGSEVGKITNYVTKNSTYLCGAGYISFRFKLYVTDPYLIWNTPYYIKGESFELPLDINVYNKLIVGFRVIIGDKDNVKASTQLYTDINLHNCVYANKYDWYKIDDKSITCI